MTTVLTLIQDFTEKMGLPRPAALVGSQEKSVRQLNALLRETISDLGKYGWSEQTLRFTWTALGAQDQGALTTIFGLGYDGLIQDSLWNQTRRMRLYGPVPNTVWQALQTLPNAGPEFQFWISGGHLYVSPTLAVTDTLSAQYITKYTVLAVDGVTAKARVTADDDSLLFPDDVVTRGLEYKWRKQKGEAGWEDDYNAYIGLVANALTKDGAPTLSLSRNNKGARPGIVIPAGSWNV